MSGHRLQSLDTERDPRIASELLAPDPIRGAADPERLLVPQPPDRHGVRPAVTAQRGQHADVWPPEEFLEDIESHAGHDRNRSEPRRAQRLAPTVAPGRPSIQEKPDPRISGPALV